LKTIAMAVLPSLLAAACDNQVQPCFMPPSVVQDVRILAVAADAPEVRFDPATFLADPVTLRTLIVRPQIEVPSSSVTWDVCAPRDDSPGCPAGSTVGSNPEWKPDSSITVQVPAHILQESIAADPLRGLRDVRVRVVVHVVGAKPESASALVFFTSRPGPLNQPPAIVGLRAGIDGSPLRDLPANPFFVQLSEARKSALRPVLAPGALEEYESVDLDGRPVLLRERVTYSFFTDASVALGRGLTISAGPVPIIQYRGLDDFEADEPEPGTPDTPDGLFDAVPSRGAFTLGTVGEIWIVARDSRGGTSWLTVPYVAIEERPGCQEPQQVRALTHDCPELQFGCL
jgi:hypothetical protein